jgi:hypothetical protein
MSDKARVHARLNTGNQFEFYDTTTFEVVQVNAPLQFGDDFLGGGHTAGIPAAGAPVAGYPWVKKIVGAAPPTVALVANGQFGQIAMALAATSEKEDAALYWNDNLSIDATKGAIWQARAQLSVLPSVAGVLATMGLHSPWIDGPNSAAEYVHFQANGNGNILMQAFDGTNTYSFATAVTVLATDWHIYRIDCSDVTDIKFFIDGVQQNTTGQIKFGATGAAAILQAYNSMYKASGTGVGTLTLDSIDITSFRV